MKSVALIITRFMAGGASEVLKQIILELHSSFKFYLIAGPGDFSEEDFNEIAEYCSFYSIPNMFRSINPLKDYIAYRQLCKLLAELNPDIVHTHTSKAGVLGRFAAKRAGIKFIMHSPHGCIYLSGSHISGIPRFSLGLKFLQLAEKAAGVKTHALIALSQNEKNINVKLGLFQGEKILIIPNGINCAKFQNASDLDFSLIQFYPHEFKDKTVISVIGRLSPEKGQYLLLEAIELLLQKTPVKNLCIFLIGDGPDKNKLETYSKKISDKFGIQIEMPGHTKNVNEFLKLTDIFVLPSFYEGFGLALVEAMAAGVPVIASESGGVPEIIDDGVDGLLFSSGDNESLSEKIDLLLKNEELSDLIATNAVEKAKKFDVQKMVDKYRTLYAD